MLTVIGMGTVFVALGALAALIQLIDWLVGRWEGGSAFKKPQNVGKSAVGRAEAGGEEYLLPVIAAAVGAYVEAEAAQVFLLPVERPDRSRWVMEGRVAALSRREGS